MNHQGVEKVEARAYRLPTDTPESDGTLTWDSTTIVVVEAHAGRCCGLGYIYGSAQCRDLIDQELAPLVCGQDPMAVRQTWERMVRSVRNLGRPGIASAAIAAVDIALWDLKARQLEVPLLHLLGSSRDAVPAYASGGFTSYSELQLTDQLSHWGRQGFSMMKIKVGRDPEHDVERVRLARKTIPDGTQLFVDANGAYARKQALALAGAFADSGVTWFEEPVSSEDLDGLRLIRDRAPAGMEIAAGEYGSDAVSFLRLLEAKAVDVLQPDVTRCGGISGFLQAAALCDAFKVPLSAHTAPSLHASLCCALPAARHVEYFHDHARIELRLFEGALTPLEGWLRPDPQRPGLGLDFKESDAEPFRI
jgi:L-alanine-DL-glutamate epimerase-like enolase superfamily enzyme